MNIANSITKHDGPAITPQGNRYGCTLQRYYGLANALLKIPKPDGAVTRAGQAMAPVGTHRDHTHWARVVGERTLKLPSCDVP